MDICKRNQGRRNIDTRDSREEVVAANPGTFCYGAAPDLGQRASKNELRDLGWFNGEGKLGHHTGLTEG